MMKAPDVKELLGTLVAFDTTSAKSNLPLIDFVRGYLARHGIQSTLIPAPEGEKAALFATIGEGDGGIGLSAHSDCVPIDGQSWSSDPFTLTEREGRLYGRGACDMKGFLACVLASVPLFRRRKGGQPIYILLSYDEEVGCLGVRPLIARFGKDVPKPSLVIVGEPSNMKVIDAHKSIDAFTTIVTGREAHSSVPQLGVNAIAIAAELIGELGRIGTELARERTDRRFDPPFSTISVGTIRGGSAANIVPKHCRFQWQVRGLPGTDASAVSGRLASVAETVLPRMRDVTSDASIETRHENSVPAFLASNGSPAISLALKLTGQNEIAAVSYGTEAGLFEQAGVPAAICGPGDVAQAHTADEFITVEQLDRCLAFLARLADVKGD